MDVNVLEGWLFEVCERPVAVEVSEEHLPSIDIHFRLMRRQRFGSALEIDELERNRHILLSCRASGSFGDGLFVGFIDAPHRNIFGGVDVRKSLEQHFEFVDVADAHRS